MGYVEKSRRLLLDLSCLVVRFLYFGMSVRHSWSFFSVPVSREVGEFTRYIFIAKKTMETRKLLSPKTDNVKGRAELLEASLALTHVKYHVSL